MNPQDTTDPDDRSIEVPARKVYEKPRLQVYGDLADITKTVSGTKTNDGAGHPNRHFTS